MGFLIVFIGGGLGSAIRHGCNIAALRLFGTDYPFGTFAINVLGSFLMGAVTEYFALRSGMSQPLRLFLTTGILGGFTTFSTFSLETGLLYQRGEAGAALFYAMGSVAAGVGALFMGLALVRGLTS